MIEDRMSNVIIKSRALGFTEKEINDNIAAYWWFRDYTKRNTSPGIPRDPSTRFYWLAEAYKLTEIRITRSIDEWHKKI